jgi:GST-like protein
MSKYQTPTLVSRPSITNHAINAENYAVNGGAQILIALEEMTIAYQPHHVSVFRGQQFEADILALNPIGKVPILIDPDGPARGMPIFESGAILVYLAETYGPNFFPVSGLARYNVLKWLFLQVANMGPALGNHSHFRMIADDNPYAAARFRRMAAQVYNVLNERLAEARYLGGADYSIADIATYPWALYLQRHGMRDVDCPHLVDWTSRIKERPAVQAAGVVMDMFGRLDATDHAAATPENIAMFTGHHIQAPTAIEAATEWKRR